MNALYFSRSIIPYQRNAEKQDWLKNHTYYKHIGLYAYRAEVLKRLLRCRNLRWNWQNRWNNSVGWRMVIPLKPVLPK